MKMIEIRNVYKRIGALIPNVISKAFEEQTKYSGIMVESKEFMGFLFFYAVSLGFILWYIFSLFIEVPFLLGFPALSMLLITLFYMLMYFVAEGKAMFVERILPDALQLLASNIKIGLTTERALIVSGRPEFGPLADEFRKAGKKILAGTRTDIAIKEISKGIRSKKLEKTVWLMLQGLGAGGELADLLIQLSNDLKTEEAIETETRANIAVYTSMIFFVAMIGGPALLGISVSIVKAIAANIGAFPSTQLTGLPSLTQTASIQQQFTAPQIKQISIEFVSMIATLLIVINSIFSSLILGIITTGNERNGAKFIPVTLIVSWVVFWLAGLALGRLFTGIA
jgi:flagellar protein FlaJ